MGKPKRWENVLRNAEPNAKAALDSLKIGSRAIVFDTETTGLAGVDGQTEESIKIIQFSALLFEVESAETGSDGLVSYTYRELAEFNEYVNPMEVLSGKVKEVTGIEQEIINAADPEEVVLPRILSFMKKAPVWVAYNQEYDCLRLKYACERCGLAFEKAPVVLDVLRMAQELVDKSSTKGAVEEINAEREKGKKLRGPCYKLEVVTRTVAPDAVGRFHDSMEDVRATAACLRVFHGLYRTYADALASREPLYLGKVTDVQLRLSKYNRSSTALVFKTEKGFLDWPKWKATEMAFWARSSERASVLAEFASADFTKLQAEAVDVAKSRGVRYDSCFSQAGFKRWVYEPSDQVQERDEFLDMAVKFWSFWQASPEGKAFQAANWTKKKPKAEREIRESDEDIELC